MAARPSVETEVALDPAAFVGMAFGSPDPFRPQDIQKFPGVVVACPTIVPPAQLMGFPPTVPCGTLAESVLLHPVRQNGQGDTHLVCAACGYATIYRVQAQRFVPFPCGQCEACLATPSGVCDGKLNYPGGFLQPRRPGSRPGKLAVPGAPASLALAAAKKAQKSTARRKPGRPVTKAVTPPPAAPRARPSLRLQRPPAEPPAPPAVEVVAVDAPEVAAPPAQPTGFTCPAHAKGCPPGAHPWMA